MRTLLSKYSRYSLNIILLSFFSHMSYFRKKVERGNQLVQTKKLSKKRIFLKIKLAKIITAQNDKNLQVFKGK